MKISLIQGLVLSGVILLAVACDPVTKTVTHKNDNKPAKPTVAKFVKCKTSRPEMCTEEYRPVCATRNTGMRCGKAPCPATKKLTYPNACSACADKKVSGYLSGGACKK